MKKTSGYTILELLVAMGLSIGMLVPVVQTLVSSRKTYEFQRELMALQDNGRFAMDFMGTRLRQAGWGGSAGQLPNGLGGCNGNNCMGGGVSNIGDMVQLTYNTDAQSSIDCFNALPPAGIPTLTVTNAFYVANNQGVPSLFCQSSVGGPQVLLPYVENMQVTYGVDTGGSIQYLPASNAAGVPIDMAQVVVVRVSLLMRGERENRISANNQTYQLEDVLIGAQNDHFMRRAYHFTMRLRNRGLGL